MDEFVPDAKSNSSIVPSKKRAAVMVFLSLLMMLHLTSDNRNIPSAQDIASGFWKPMNRNSPPEPRLSFRFDWSSVPVQSQLAKRIQESQTIHPNCRNGKDPSTADSTNVRFWKFQATKQFGLGAAMHVWSQHICNVMEEDIILLWRDQWNWNFCQEDHSRLGFLYDQRSCYFQNNHTVEIDNGTQTSCNVMNLLPKEEHDPRIQPNRGIDNWGLPRKRCGTLMERMNITTNDFRAAAMEWLFSNVHDRVIDEARRQMQEAFGEEGLPDPEDMVTVHVRWGDKKSEMELVSIEEYIKLTKEVTATRKVDPQANETLHVYLATEDQDAIFQFKQKSPPNWKIHLSGPVTPRDTKMTTFANGEAGLQSLGALLLSLESNFYVLTLASNWSMLINELRKNIVNARCGDCTRMASVNVESW